MPLYKCTRCGAVENTALGDYWSARYDGRDPLCSECATGTWHGKFPKLTPDEAGLVPGDGGYLYSPKELEPGGYTHGQVARDSKPRS